VKFDAYVFGARRLEKTDSLETVKSNFRISRVMADNHLMRLRKSHDLLKEGAVGDSACRIVRIIQKHQPGLVGNSGGNGIQVGQKTIRLP
jgi:hypothetical protein